MKAARIHEYGSSSVIHIEEVPRPEPKAGQVLIRVAASSFNHLDSALRSGALAQMMPLALPYTLGVDVSGTVEAVGDGVATFAPGDSVVGYLSPFAGGGNAEYVVVEADVLTAAPTAMPLVQAAALPMAGLAAFQMVFEHARVKSGDRVLINGGSGSVGSVAVQLAHQAGAQVISTASPGRAVAISGFGADQVIDYTQGAVGNEVDGPVDVLLNIAFVDESLAARLVSLVRDGGTVVSATNTVAVAGRDLTVIQSGAHPDANGLSTLVQKVDAGTLKLFIGGVHPLSTVAEIHDRGSRGELRGRALIAPTA